MKALLLFAFLFVAVQSRVEVGVETLAADSFNKLAGKRVGLLSNPTGILPDTLDHIVDFIHDHASKVNLAAVFGPEHGFRGDHQDGQGGQNFLDPRTGVMVYDVYGKRGDALVKIVQASKVDLVMFDIQDVGVRFYTYIWSMYDMMTVCATLDIPFMVLDRPNPIGAVNTHGPVLDIKYQSGVGRLPIALVHGMTVGELAQMFNAEFMTKKVSLTVIPMKNYVRTMKFADTGLPWVQPSPNMPTENTAEVYPGMGFIEGTKMSEGRGTTRPFELTGAPFIMNCTFESFAHALADVIPPTVAKFRDAYFIPTHDKLQGQLCAGVQVYPMAKFDPVRVAVNYLHILINQCPTAFPWRTDGFINLLSGNDLLKTMLDSGASADAILTAMSKDMDKYDAMRAKYLIY